THDATMPLFWLLSLLKSLPEMLMNALLLIAIWPEKTSALSVSVESELNTRLLIAMLVPLVAESVPPELTWMLLEPPLAGKETLVAVMAAPELTTIVAAPLNVTVSPVPKFKDPLSVIVW